MFRFRGTGIAVLSAGSLLYSLANSDSFFYNSSLFTSLLFNLVPDAEEAHSLAIKAGELGLFPRSFFPKASKIGGDGNQNVILSISPWENITFPHPVGMAAGFDKNAEAINSILGLNFSHVEIGSVTPYPQDGNEKPRVFRLVPDKAVINRYGFNSKGHDYVAQKLGQGSRSGLVGVNLGKNKTSSDAANDYVQGVKKLGSFADYLVVNISSPNTVGLRSLQFDHTFLIDMISKVKTEIQSLDLAALRNSTGRKPPLLVKLAPDMTDEELSSTVKVLVEQGVDGIIVSNTTVSRPSTLKSDVSLINQTGGLSGKPLESISREMIGKVYRITQGSIPIISVGGLDNGKEAYHRIRQGASLLQLYTGMIYEGPGLANRIVSELESCMLSDGFNDISQVIGADWKADSK